MFTLVTSAFFCNRPNTDPQNGPVKAFQRGKLQNIASAIDIILGIGMICGGFATHMPILTMVGALQLWPLLAFVTLALLGYKQGMQKETIYLRFKPCACISKKNVSEVLG